MLLFLDVNETLIRTGRVELGERLTEQRELETFRTLVATLGGRPAGLVLVLLTGNSFEYTRRVEEPLGLRELPGVRVVLVSENGLLARDFQTGDLWRETISEAHREATARFVSAAGQRPLLAGRFFTQGNELRTTLKPVANAFTPAELAAFGALSLEPDLTRHARVYLHRFYVDIDPRLTEGGERPGKALAVARLSDAEPGRGLVAIGDSASDLPMFEAVLIRGGNCFVVANSTVTPPGVARTRGAYTAGVNEVLAALAARP